MCRPMLPLRSLRSSAILRSRGASWPCWASSVTAGGTSRSRTIFEIAETTVNFHIKNLITKLRAHDRTHAVMTAIRRGVLTI